MATATSFTVLNYAGLLYTKSNKRTPILNSIGAPKYTDHVEFPVSLEYSLGSAAQPAISETASLTAPQPTSVTRSQAKNVCQIFHEAVSVSYAKASNMGTMSGINIARDVPNPASELDFQIARRMEKIANDVEYTFTKGVYNLANSDATINKSKGLMNAISTNVVEYSTSTGWTKANLISLFKSIYDNGGNVDDCILLLSSTDKIKLTGMYEGQTGYLMPTSRTIGGANIIELVTDFGTVDVVMSPHLSAGEVMAYNPNVCAPVEMNVPGKGNFFYEELAKTGAAVSGQIFGQIGLDFGPEWFHGKLVAAS